MALGQPGTEDTHPLSVVSPEDTLNGLATLPYDTPGYVEIVNQYMQPQGANIPAQEPPQMADMSEHIHPDSHSLIAAMDNGYVDKKLMNPIESIREGVQAGDTDLIAKGHTKLADLLSKTSDMNPVEKFMDMFFNNGRVADAQRYGNKIAADLVMRELMRPGSTQAPGAEEANRMGLIDQNELLPGQMQNTEVPMTIPQGGFQFSSEGDVSMTPATSKSTQSSIDPKARLTPFQEEVAGSRQKGLQSGLAYRSALAGTQIDLNRERTKDIQVKRETELPFKIAAQRSLDGLRTAQAELAHARVDWYKQLPSLRKELSTGTSAFEMDALKRVHSAIQTQEPIDKADWLIAERWLRKGSPRFSVDFTGKMVDRLTGRSERGSGGPIGWDGLPKPPDTAFTPEEHSELKSGDDDIMHQIGQVLGSLLQGITGTKGAELPMPKTPAEAHKLAPGTRYRTPDGKEMVR